MISRNSREYLNRVGLRAVEPHPAPRLDIEALLLNLLPLEAPLPKQSDLMDYDGRHYVAQPQDRGIVKPWHSK